MRYRGCRELQPEGGILNSKRLVAAQQEANESKDGQNEDWHGSRLFVAIPLRVNLLTPDRIMANNRYEADDDDFKVETFFCCPEVDTGKQPPFCASDKRMCGFLFLRSLRTGSRALSLEHGSLLDIILRVREIRPKMWEQVLEQLRKLAVADDPSIGLSGILSGIQSAISEFVPLHWAADPHLRVSNLPIRSDFSLRPRLTVWHPNRPGHAGTSPTSSFSFAPGNTFLGSGQRLLLQFGQPPSSNGMR